jgi:TRAP transporter TAXI family solute receptor
MTEEVAMKGKKALMIGVAALFFLGIFLLASSPAQAKEATKLLSCTTYSVGSTGYSISMGIMEAVQEREGIKIKVVPAGTDKSKILPLKEGMMQLSLFTGAGQYYAMMGLDEFAEKDWGPQPLRLVYACPEGAVAGMMVRGNSGIKTLADLKGKRVTLIPASPACKSLHEGYMAFGGVSWDDVKIVQVSSWGAAWDSVIDGSSDTAHCLINSAKAVELAASPNGIHWLPVPPENKEGWAKLNKFCPYLMPYKATNGAGASEEKPAHIASYYYGFVSYPNLDEEVVYRIARGVWNGYDDYSSKHPALKLWTREGALKTDSFLTPYHPGAIKFFKEMGKWTPVHEKRQAILLQEEAARMKK